MVGDLAGRAAKASTRREYVQIKGFHRFLQARKAAEIQAGFGVRLVRPVDESTASRHVGNDSPALAPPPTPERVNDFATSSRTGSPPPQMRARSTGLRTVPDAVSRWLRSEEASLLDTPDPHSTVARVE